MFIKQKSLTRYCMSKQNKVCYTAIFGDYEELKTPAIVSEGWDYICFTDQPLESDVWKIVKMDVIDTPQRTARWVKIMGWIDWEYSMWVDASFQINIDLNGWWDLRYKTDFNCAKHPLRNSIYHECRSCNANGRGDGGKVDEQWKRYIALDVPEYGCKLITSGILLRKNTDENIKLHEAWWKELSSQSVRDQLAFAFVSKDVNFINMYLWDYSQSKEFKYIKHKHLRH